MGYNTSVVVMNDAEIEISQDHEFGPNLAAAIRKVSLGIPVDVKSGSHIHAATVIETHHADFTTLIAMGGNCGREVARVCTGNQDLAKVDELILRELADRLGYRVVRKSK